MFLIVQKHVDYKYFENMHPGPSLTSMEQLKSIKVNAIVNETIQRAFKNDKAAFFYSEYVISWTEKTYITLSGRVVI